MCRPFANILFLTSFAIGRSRFSGDCLLFFEATTLIFTLTLTPTPCHQATSFSGKFGTFLAANWITDLTEFPFLPSLLCQNIRTSFFPLIDSKLKRRRRLCLSKHCAAPTFYFFPNKFY